VKLYVGGRSLNFIPQGKHIVELHRKSRKVTNVLIAEKFMRDAGLSLEDQLRGGISERSGVLPLPNAGWEHLPDSRRWNYLEHHDFAAHLGGKAPDVLGHKFAERLGANLTAWARRQSTDAYDWIHVPDLVAFMREQLFLASTAALYGDEILRIAPDLCADFWTFISKLPTLFRGIPLWLVPGASAARRRVLGSFRKWEQIKRQYPERVESDLQSSGHEWDAIHGAKMTRARTQMYRDFSISEDGACLFHFAMMFA